MNSEEQCLIETIMPAVRSRKHGFGSAVRSIIAHCGAGVELSEVGRGDSVVPVSKEERLRELSRHGTGPLGSPKVIDFLAAKRRLNENLV